MEDTDVKLMTLSKIEKAADYRRTIPNQITIQNKTDRIIDDFIKVPLNKNRD